MTAPFYANKIQYYPLNQKGQDYVIGDVHGRYDLVDEALIKVGFNPLQDRLFCVGDLIDRGAYSHLVLEFLALPYVYAIRGNHEDMLLELYQNDEKPTEELIAYYGSRIGLDWWLDVNEVKREKIIQALRLLPIVAEVKNIRGNIGLLHADIAQGLSWDEFKTHIENNNEHVVSEALWGRKRLTHGVIEDVEGIGRIYVGHTPQEHILKLGNIVAMDTGAVFDNHLTLANMACKTVIINQPQKVFEHLNILNPEDTTTVPFGTGYIKHKL